MSKCTACSSRARSTSDRWPGRCRPAVGELHRLRQGSLLAGQPNHRTTRSKSLAVRSVERRLRVPPPASSHPPAVPPIVERSEDHRPTSASTCELPPLNHSRGSGPPAADPARASAAQLVRVVSSRITRQPSPLAVEWPEDHFRTRSSGLRAATTASPPKGIDEGDGPGSLRSDTAPRASSRVESPVDRPTSPSGGPETTFGWSASARGLLPSCRLWGRRSGSGPDSILGDADTTHLVSRPAHPLTVPPLALGRPEGQLRTQGLRSASCCRPATLGGDVRAADPTRSSATRQTARRARRSRHDRGRRCRRPRPREARDPDVVGVHHHGSRRPPGGSRPEGPESRRPGPKQLVGVRRTVLRVLPATKAP
jgi:hypothetical protein